MDASTYAAGCLLELLKGKEVERREEGKVNHSEVKKGSNLVPGKIIKGPNNLTIRIETTKDNRIGKYNKNGLTKKGIKMMEAYYEE